MTVTTEDKVILKQGVDYKTLFELKILINKLLEQGYLFKNIDTEAYTSKK